MARRNDPAPHGYEADGTTPKTPYGVNMDGTPRKSNRGSRPGQRGNQGIKSSAAPTIVTTSTKSDHIRKDTLLGLADMLIVTPLATSSMVPAIRKRIGDRQADALAGDALIFDHFSPGLADGLIVLSHSKPGLLAWMDNMEEKAPYLMLMQSMIGMTKALAANHLRPDQDMAKAGRNLVQMRMAARIIDIENAARQARAAGAIPEEVIPDAGAQDYEG